MFGLFGKIPTFHDDSAILLLGAERVLHDVQKSVLHLLRAGIIGVQLATTLP